MKAMERFAKKNGDVRKIAPYLLFELTKTHFLLTISGHLFLVMHSPGVRMSYVHIPYEQSNHMRKRGNESGDTGNRR